MALESPSRQTNEPNKSAFQIIRTPEALTALADRLGRATVIAVDMEADSMYHFHEKICLVQIGTRKMSALIDPLEVRDFSCLREIFANPDIMKVFHGADYDIRSFHRDFRIAVANLFDTQIAARFLGATATGLEAVIHDRFGVSMEKKYQKKDWSQRPLPAEMLKYAASDIKYLIPLADQLTDELNRKGRLDWVREECEILGQVRSATADNEPLFMKFKGAGRMNRRTLGVLESLLELRMETAKRKDRPPFKVFSNSSIQKIAASRPTNTGRLEQLHVLSRRQLMMHGKDIVSRVKACLEIPDAELPVYPRKKAPVLPAETPNRVKALKTWRNKVARMLNIDPPLICNKSLMTTIATINPKNRAEIDAIDEMRNWQKAAFGADILRTLAKVP